MKVAFITTNFGFGPVSKTDYIIKALRENIPNAMVDFYGTGISMEYISANSPVDHIYICEYEHNIHALLERIVDYDFVVNVMEMDVLKYWKKEYPPLLLVDSLNWLWDQLPEGIEKVSQYFIQDFLLNCKNIREDIVSTHIINPITIIDSTPCKEENILLVNYSGMCNPFTSKEFFHLYAKTCTELILELFYEQFDKIVFTTNVTLAQELRELFREYSKVEFDFLKHDEFINIMKKSRYMLSTPGITATLEGKILGKNIGYLLPSNYSQVLLSQKYMELDPACKVIKLEDFNPAFHIPEGLPESTAVPMVNDCIKQILLNYQESLRERLSDILYHVSSKKHDIATTGQEQIVDRIIQMKKKMEKEIAI
ncbi:hypothetical protein COM79_24955 [Bacillus cereus]|uniref:hypothetical protein n=1 Tax=Bacillus cereus group TaxID=86661 RepID=UPI000BEBBDD5|nr:MULTISPECIES: hypothetical protein [Bacillus cereus group]PEB54482.1 hypothetical protein COM79_24955 [Bacillus cereus]PEB85651.1 hypothetical protein COM94_19095 [Bacillus thuringiensis]PGK93086.1 hypothetical protein CN911_21215 [Bacillus thuringiensis]